MEGGRGGEEGGGGSGANGAIMVQLLQSAQPPQPPPLPPPAAVIAALAARIPDYGTSSASGGELFLLVPLPAPLALLRASSTRFRRATIAQPPCTSSSSSFGGGGSIGGREERVGEEEDEEKLLGRTGEAEEGGRGSSIAAGDNDADGGGRGSGGGGGGGGVGGGSGDLSCGADEAFDASEPGTEAAKRRVDKTTSGLKWQPCYVCQWDDGDAVLIECGHRGICYECTLAVITAGAHKGCPTCPICRQNVTQVLQVGDAVATAENKVVYLGEGVALRLLSPPSPLERPLTPYWNSRTGL